MIDRGQPGKATGVRLLRQSDTLFHLWHQLEEDQLSRTQFQEAMKPVRQAVREALQAGRKSRCGTTAGTCTELWGHEEWLWTFVDVEGVKPTNNEAEQAERQGVLWRKISGGTDSPQGSRFVERVLTVVETCRRQSRKVLDYLGACIEAWRQKGLPPSLIPNTS